MSVGLQVIVNRGSEHKRQDHRTQETSDDGDRQGLKHLLTGSDGEG